MKINYREFIQDNFTVLDYKTQQPIPFRFNPVQELYYKYLQEDYKDINGVREIILKARREGMSSFVLALFTADFLLRPYSVSICISHKKQATELLFKQVKFYLQSYCEKNKIELKDLLATETKGMIENRLNHAMFYIGTAGAKVGGRGGFARNLHFSECLSKNSLIVGRDGFVFPITDAPEYIRDGNGSLIKTMGIKKTKPTEGLKSIKAYGNFPFPIEATLSHKLWVRTGTRYNYTEGWKRVGDITKNDYLGFPVTEVRGKSRSPFTHSLSADFGEFCGWYLAEGSMGKGRIDLAIHTKEKEYIDQLLNRLGIKHSFYERGNNTAVYICDVKFRQEILSFFGEKEQKKIPDQVWGFGKEFNRGLLRGFFLGDGRCKGQQHQLSVASIRPQLIVQLKRLLISLRLAYPGIQVQKAGTQKTRNNKEIWTLTITGKGYTRVADFIGIERTKRVDKRDKGYNKYFHFGTKYFWAKVASIEDMPPEEEVYDVVLNAEPHSFCLLASKSHNCAFYQDTELITAQEIVTATAQQVPAGVGMIFIESCVAGDTLVNTSHGYHRIDSFFPLKKQGYANTMGIELLGRYGYQPVTKLFYNGTTVNNRLTTQSGYALTATANHPILALTKDGQEWRETKDIQIGDYVCLQAEAKGYGDFDLTQGFVSTSRKGTRFTTDKFTPTALSKLNLAYFLGLFLAEGYCRDKKSGSYVVISSGDELIHQQLAEWTGVSWVRNDKFHSRCTKRSLVEYLLHLGFSLEQKAPLKNMPDFVFRLPKAELAAFISGMFDGDGTTHGSIGSVSYISSSEQMIRNLQILLLKFGIFSAVRKHPAHDGGLINGRQIIGGPSYTLELNKYNSLKFYQTIGFRLQRKQVRKSLIKEANLRGELVPLITQGLLRQYVKEKKTSFATLHKTTSLHTAGLYTGGAISQIKLRKILDTLGLTDVRLNELAFAPYRWEKVIAKEKVECETYDVTIPNGSSFMSNGFMSHNTANGEGNYYHSEWQRAYIDRMSTYHPRFFGWDLFYTKDEVEARRLDFPNEKLFMQEYPQCVIGETMISGDEGLMPIQNNPNRLINGIAPVITITTVAGRKITLTRNHGVYNGVEYKPAGNYQVGDTIALLPPVFQKKLQYKIVKLGLKSVKSELVISEKWGRFLGIYMGDGSLSGKNQNYTLSVVCDSKDQDFIKDTKQLIAELFVEPSQREIGNATEIRVGNRYFRDLFYQLGLVYQNSSQNFKRKVHVPDYIKQSPSGVIKEFLRGIFETDGFVADASARIVLFSKHEDFLRDIQLLLLGFGITSRIKIADKEASDGHMYIGRELRLNGMEVKKFNEEIGFLSKRKQARFLTHNYDNKHNKLTQINLFDTITDIQEEELAVPVYNLTTKNHYYSANGIWTHNSPEEAFLVSGEPFFDVMMLDAMQKLKAQPIQQGRIAPDGNFV